MPGVPPAHGAGHWQSQRLPEEGLAALSSPGRIWLSLSLTPGAQGHTEVLAVSTMEALIVVDSIQYFFFF